MKKMQADVAIIAMGLSGLAAAITAAENGASVIGLEKMRVPGGRANMGMGPFAVESRVQRNAQINLTKEKAFAMHMEYCHWDCDARMVHDYYWKSADTIDWLMDMGVEFMVQRYFPAAEVTAHNVIPEGGGLPGPRSAGTMIKRMTERAEQLGVQTLLETPVKKILVEDGKVVGVLAQHVSGEEVEVRAKVVIAAAGGLGDNRQMVQECTGEVIDEKNFFADVPGITGDGCRMAWEAGAGKGNMTVEYSVGLYDNFNHFVLEGAFKGKPDLMVNLDGQRFMNEESTEMTTFNANCIRRQKDCCAFVIMDEKRLKYLKKHGPEKLDQVHGHDFYDRFDEAAQEAIDAGYPDFHIASSVEELAEKTGINLKGLQNTLEEYNYACDTGRDEVLCKNAKYLFPVRTPKFYCCKVMLQTHGAVGGIKTNYKTEVLDGTGEVMPGFYAVGTESCDIYGPHYNLYLPGNNMGYALNSGRIAGENAVEYINAL